MYWELAFELQFFAICILWGGLVLLAYDFLRIVRRLIKHGNLLLAVEDLFFWIIAAIFIFAMIYRQNNGIIRGFSVIGMTIGMLLYNQIVQDRLVNIIVKAIRILIKPVAALFRLIKKRISRFITKVQNILKVLSKRLKLAYKSIKIKIDNRRQKSAIKRQQKLQKRQQEKLRQAKHKQAKRKADKKKQNKNDKGAAVKSDGQEKETEGSNGGYKQLQVHRHKKEAVFARLSEEELKQIQLKNRN